MKLKLVRTFATTSIV